MDNFIRSDENEFLRIWFNIDRKEEYYETIRLELGNTNKVSLDKYKQYNSIIRQIGKSLKKYKLKDKTITTVVKEKPYIEKIGLLLMNFLNTDFSDFDKSFDNFYSIYGCEFLYDYSINELYNDTFNTEQDAYNTLKILHDRGCKELIKLQTDFKNATDFIFNLNNDTKYVQYSNQSRFSACLVSNKFNLKDYSSKIKIETKVNNYNYDGTTKISFDTILDEIDYNSFMINIINVYLINDIATLLFVVLHQLVNNDFIVKKCQICNKYFVPSKANEIYCEFINEDINAICRDIGAFQMYKKNIESVPGLLEYRRTYNKKSNEVSRNKGNNVIRGEFIVWKTLAQSVIKDYKQGKITEDELYEWMIKNK